MTRWQGWMFDAFVLIGLVLFGAGVYEQFGSGWCKIAVGAILLFGTVYLLLRPTDDSTGDTS